MIIKNLATRVRFRSGWIVAESKVSTLFSDKNLYDEITNFVLQFSMSNFLFYEFTNPYLPLGKNKVSLPIMFVIFPIQITVDVDAQCNSYF